MRRRESSKRRPRSRDQGSWTHIKEMGCWRERSENLTHVFPFPPTGWMQRTPRTQRRAEQWSVRSLVTGWQHEVEILTANPDCDEVKMQLYWAGPLRFGDFFFFFFFKATVGVPWLTQILLLFERCQHLILKDLANCNCCYTHEFYSLLMTHSLKEYFHLDYLDFSTIYSNATEYCFKNDLSWDLCFLELGLKIMLNY